MNTIEVSKKTPIILGDKRVTRIEISPVNFVAFVKMAEEVAAMPGGNDRKKFNMLNRRARIKRQAIPYAGEERLVFDDLAISQLPIAIGREINNAIDAGAGEPGKIVNPNDAITAPTLFKLGTPIKFKNADGEGSFSEIEFIAKTFGDIEEVISETSEPQQILAALRTIAKPVGMSSSLLSMPQWAIDEITVADGFAMAEQVLPRFFE